MYPIINSNHKKTNTMLNNGQEALMKNMVLKRIVYVGDVRPRIGIRLFVSCTIEVPTLWFSVALTIQV
jgi:hypothetical protein